MNPICLIQTPFTEKFGIPRQSLLVNEAWGKLSFPKNDFFIEAFRGLEGFSHLWLIFQFHQIPDENFNGLVRPPRYGGKKKFGVYATRSPHRPNRLGLSVVKFDRLEVTSDSVILWVTGVDLVNGTPIYDIKPYLPYADAIPEAMALEFELAPVSWPVSWACVVEMNMNDKALIEKILALDPRPGQDRQSSDEFAMSVAGWNITFSFLENGFKVLKAVRE